MTSFPNEFILSKKQQRLWDSILQSVFDHPDAALVGGTALSAVYFGHRQSDDFDFHIRSDSDDQVQRFVRALSEKTPEEQFHNPDTPSRTWKTLLIDDIKVQINQVDHEWTHSPIVVDGVIVESVPDLLQGKIHAIATREKLRDPFDLYIADQQEYDVRDALFQETNRSGRDVIDRVTASVNKWCRKYESSETISPRPWIPDDTSWPGAKFYQYLEDLRDYTAELSLDPPSSSISPG